MQKDEIVEFLKANSSDSKSNFDKKLIDTKYEILGIKTSVLEDFSKKIEFDDNFKPTFHEEILLYGMTIARRKDKKEKIRGINTFLAYVDNWATCDMIACRLKKLESEKDFFFSLLQSKNPFYVRFGLVWIMRFYLKIDLKLSINAIKGVKFDQYYVNMAKSWAYAEGLLYDFDYVLSIIKAEEDFVKRKSIQKAIESFRITSEQKNILREYRSTLI